MIRAILIVAVLLVVPARAQETTPPAATARTRYEPQADSEVIESFPYTRYHTTDQFDREITFYLSKPPADAPAGASLPLIVSVQGSGSQSVFLEVDTPNGKRIGSGGPEAVVLREYRAKARILVVEKPGVTFLVQPQRPGGAEESSPEFRAEHTLDRWVEALSASILAASKIDGVDASYVLALGHSEGAQVVSHLAAKNPSVTHVAALAGGGPTQLFDLLELAREGTMGVPGATAQERVDWMVAEWNKVLADPQSTDKFFLGHPYRRWTSFLQTSAVDAILSSKANVFLAQGAADTAVSPTATDVMYAELVARGRRVTYRRVDGADHGFMVNGDRQGWVDTIHAAVDWFMASRGGP